MREGVTAIEIKSGYGQSVVDERRSLDVARSQSPFTTLLAAHVTPPEFAGRAVQSWKGLGFQLIVGAPPDKVSALEPHMDALLMVTKNTATHFSYVAAVSDAEDFLVRSATAGIAEALGREG